MTQETDKEREAKKYLNQRQIVFIQEFMKTNNVTQSAIKAGYSKKTASAQGSRLLQNIKAINYINAINERLESEKIADIEEVMQFLTAVMRGEKKDQFGMDTSIQDRTRAATELARRLDVRTQTSHMDVAVTIVDDIPNMEVQSDGNN